MSSIAARQTFARRTGLLAITVLFLLPVAWLISTAWKPSDDIFAIPPRLDFTPTLAQFHSVFAYFDVWSLLRSSVIISLGSALLSLLLGVPAGYALARSRSRAAVLFAYFFLAIRMVPAVAALFPMRVHVVVAGAHPLPVAALGDIMAAVPAPVATRPDKAGARLNIFHEHGRRWLRCHHFHIAWIRARSVDHRTRRFHHTAGGQCGDGNERGESNKTNGHGRVYSG